MEANTSTVREQINSVLNLLPDHNMDTVLNYLQDLISIHQRNEEVSRHLDIIMKQDDNLLKRLAQ